MRMARQRTPAKLTKSTSPGKKPRARADFPTQEMVDKLLWDIASINVHLDEVRDFWAKALGVSGPQWMILMALNSLDQGSGVPLKDVVAKLHVDPSFVTTQSKILEKNGLLRRSASVEDARIVLMSLTDKASQQVGELSAKRDLLNKFIFAEFEARTFRDLSDQVSTLKIKLEKAGFRLAADF
jgi:DNA-binding MarR family transcriptional regulator